MGLVDLPDRLCAISSGVITRDFLLGRGTAALFSGDATRINNLVYLYPMVGLVWASR